MSPEDYKIKTEKFEGPLDLLLNLIEKKKLLINDFTLSEITDDFVNYVSTLGKVSATKVSDFLVVASTLILIKSRSLLPSLTLEQSEEDDIRDLETRLKILKLIKDISTSVGERFQKLIRFKKKHVKVLQPKFSPSPELNPHNMRIVMLGVINTFPKFEVKKEAKIKKTISLEDTMNRLINRVKRNIKMSFSEFSGKKEKGERVNVIISFLAVLELVKRGFISANQEKKYEEINLESTEVNTPSFGS
jgi:segregation and condensation protein A